MSEPTDLHLIRPHTKACTTHLTSPIAGTYACNCGAYSPLTETVETRIREIVLEEVDLALALRGATKKRAKR